jgi:hypothetical protein
MFLGFLDPDPNPLFRGMDLDPDPLARGMDPRIRIHNKMSWIRNTAKYHCEVLLTYSTFPAKTDP